ncbi:MAG: FAD-binding protein, partial [Planctomycetota bacterium]
MARTKQILKSKIGQAIKEDVILAPFTTFKIGGPADYFFEAKTKDELTEAIKTARDSAINFFVLGTGANILVSDKGFRGFVIRNKTSQIKFSEPNLVRAESGVVFADLIEHCT